MSIEFLMMYKWEKLSDGDRKKFLGRLDALIPELSLQTKLGCADITIPVYIPLEMYNDEAKKMYKEASKRYKQRCEVLSRLVELIRIKVSNDRMVDNEYLYELWINRIFELNWRENPNLNDPVDDINKLYDALLINDEINPYDVDLTKTKKDEKKKFLKRRFNIFKK